MMTQGWRCQAESFLPSIVDVSWDSECADVSFLVIVQHFGSSQLRICRTKDKDLFFFLDNPRSPPGCE